MKKLTILRDTLHNFAPDSGASDEYCKGLLVGVVGALMASGMSWETAIAQVERNLPDNCRHLCTDNVPESWITSLKPFV